MDNGYYRDLINHLIQVGGGGARVCQLARVIYNQNTTLFERPVQYEGLRRALNSYLWRASRNRRSIFVQLSRGVYALKPHVAVQLDFDFADDEALAASPSAKSSQKAQQLYLFDF